MENPKEKENQKKEHHYVFPVLDNQYILMGVKKNESYLFMGGSPSPFGGVREKNEQAKQTLIRECWEESHSKILLDENNEPIYQDTETDPNDSFHYHTTKVNKSDPNSSPTKEFTNLSKMMGLNVDQESYLESNGVNTNRKYKKGREETTGDIFCFDITSFKETAINETNVLQAINKQFKTPTKDWEDSAALKGLVEVVRGIYPGNQAHIQQEQEEAAAKQATKQANQNTTTILNNMPVNRFIPRSVKRSINAAAAFSTNQSENTRNKKPNTGSTPPTPIQQNNASTSNTTTVSTSEQIPEPIPQQVPSFVRHGIQNQQQRNVQENVTEATTQNTLALG